MAPHYSSTQVSFMKNYKQNKGAKMQAITIAADLDGLPKDQQEGWIKEGPVATMEVSSLTKLREIMVAAPKEANIRLISN